MDWTNIDLESGYEKSHTESVFKAKYEEAIEILNDNLINITNYAKNERI